MIPFALWMVFLAAWTFAAVVGIVLGIRKKQWSRGARLAAVVIGALAALPAVYQILVMFYVANCTRPGNVCL